MAADDDYYAMLQGQQPALPPMLSPMNDMAGVLKPNPMADAMKPPASPQDLENRKTGWAQVYDKLQNDPHLRRALLTFGASMVQPIGAGESPLGNVGKAVAGGSATYQASQQAERQQGLQQREEQRK